MFNYKTESLRAIKNQKDETRKYQIYNLNYI